MSQQKSHRQHWSVPADASPEICTTCNTTVREKDEALSCEYCHQWIHAKCSSINSVAYRAIDGCGAMFKFFCSNCLRNVDPGC
uniref:PHD-type domain-containing protein n=1 Tax=Romanomermis culicivorax TaxID=13658 RepID=A0A915IPQ8_ROMCU